MSGDTPARPTVLPSEVARKISKELYAGNASFLEEEIGGTDLVLWAPQQDAVLGRFWALTFGRDARGGSASGSC